MEPVFPNQQQHQWAQQPPGGVWTPPQQHGGADPNAGGAGGGDYNVNMNGGGGGGGQLAMPFDPSTLDQPQQPHYPQVGGQIGGQIGHSAPNISVQPINGGGGSGNVWANAPATGSGWGSGPVSGHGLSGIFDNPVAGMVGGRLGEEAKARYNQAMGRLHAFKYYFSVNNSYVLQKLKILLFPCTHKDWKRQIEPTPNNQPASIELNQPPVEAVYSPPRKDVNAPDLYIPAMAFFTFALLMGYVLGVIGKFTPEVVVTQASSTLVTLILEVFVFSVGFYMVDSASPKLLDLIAWSGYKYVGLIISLFCGLMFGSWAFTVSKVYMGGASGLFLMCTLHRALTPPVEATAGGVAPTSPKRNYFLVLIGACQVLLAFFLLRAVVLSPTSGVAVPVLNPVPPGPIGVVPGMTVPQVAV